MKPYNLFLLSVVLGCELHTNQHHCANPNRMGPDPYGVCPEGQVCSGCELDNDGCVPEGEKPEDLMCLPETTVGPTSTMASSESTSETTGASSGSQGMEGSSGGSSSESTNGSSSESSSGSTNGSSSEGASFCGDGFLDLGEDCDDGNRNNNDACTNECLSATCGDGFVQPGEECDAMSTSCQDCLFVHRQVFVTSQAFGGDLGGIVGADTKCQDAATVGMFPNPTFFKAWISDGNGNTPASRFDTSFLGIYELGDGTFLAEGWNDLIDGKLDHPIDLDEELMPAGGVVWTNTKIDGTAVGLIHCDAWSSSMPLKFGRAGTTALPSAQWTDSLEQACSSPARIYCFEDLPELP